MHIYYVAHSDSHRNVITYLHIFFTCHFDFQPLAVASQEGAKNLWVFVCILYAFQDLLTQARIPIGFGLS